MTGREENKILSFFLDIFTMKKENISKIKEEIDKYWTHKSTTKEIGGQREPTLSKAIFSMGHAQVCMISEEQSKHFII